MGNYLFVLIRISSPYQVGQGARSQSFAYVIRCALRCRCLVENVVGWKRVRRVDKHPLPVLTKITRCAVLTIYRLEAKSGLLVRWSYNGVRPPPDRA